MASHAVTAAVAMPTIYCRGMTMQNACKQQENCIDDPRTLPDELTFSLFLKSRTYIAGPVSGKITSLDVVERRRFNLTIDPAIQGGTRIELSSDGKTAKLVGGDYNYLFECRKAKR
jgi:hypothetical protein